ncbi:3-deoxy-manno-octulosonate cytidylyltransferase [Methylocystis parvus]|uniref:3-deoxy-manno-octulosonate cytidylyltransferase n=1 Tax=Methylocystis parvus TaxID=134 RepID=A0A6B8M5K2_9HYPH|nr:3-deoxy-manno-octulosonate cytidylyltransferase [Methylocystis parvus]QGM99264.1 3-deoxy-manno-octulosonate cytidylyltransferase [Methylocystis parvus]WBK00350.1 3-deoxy-manno-octulosonate cytidylyltransferase [Methylocystis parvus OBBP]
MTAAGPRAPIIVIPARLGSTRLPGKALAEIGGRPMILHVWSRAVAAGLGPVAVATDSEEIAGVVRAAGGDVVATTAAHICGSDRIGEALRSLDPEGRHDAVVNLQGDTPFLPGEALAAALKLLEDPAVDIGTLATPAQPEEADDPNAVKLVATRIAPKRLRALYFTRARAPWGEGPLYKHIGVYAYRRASFERYASLPPSPLELRERLEQLRAMEAGMRIDAAVLDKAGPSVDTERDLAALRAAIGHATP